MKFNIVKILSICLLLISCEQKNTTGVTQNKNLILEKILEDYYQEKLKMFPLEATFAGIDTYNNLLNNDLDDNFIEKKKRFYQKYKELLGTIDLKKLSESDLISYKVIEWECNIELESLSFHEELLPINQFSSLHLTIGQLASGTSAQPFNTLQDYSNWLERIAEFVNWIKSVEANLQKGIEKGYKLPKILTEKTIDQIQILANNDPNNNIFYSPLKNFPSTFSEDDIKRITEEYTFMISENLVPSINNLEKFLSSEYLENPRKSDGINTLPNGDQYYKFLIKKYTTTQLTADEIHKIGLNEVARIKKEMLKVKNQVGYKADLISFFDFVRNKKELMPFTDPNQVIDNFNNIHNKIKPNLEKLFDLKPKSAFEVRRTQNFRETTASPEYQPGSLDGKRPGIFYVPIPNVTKYNIYADEDLFLHEAIPGHHYQISLQQEDTTLPSFRKTIWFTAFGEGWALYTESLGKELGLFSDPYQYFGMLSAEMHRALRLVIDTGIHTKGWTREQAIAYSIENEAEPLESIVAEIERYMAIPGQALSYKIGELKIKELRKKSEKKLDKKFNIKQFHNTILEEGCIPLDILEKKIDLWIKKVY